jgi:hypothetical protein
MSVENEASENESDIMPQAIAPIAPAPAAPMVVAKRHLFGAVGSMADAIARTEQHQRERVRAEAQRISGNFYVDRLVGHTRPR